MVSTQLKNIIYIVVSQIGSIPQEEALEVGNFFHIQARPSFTRDPWLERMKIAENRSCHTLPSVIRSCQRTESKFWAFEDSLTENELSASKNVDGFC